MRAFKNTTLVWGLATLPVGLGSAIESGGGPATGLKRFVETEDGEVHDVETATIDAVTREIVEDLDVKMGVDIGGVIHKVDAGDISDAKAATTLDSIEIEGFIPAGDLDPVAMKRPYFLQAQKKFPQVAKAMRLLYEGMKAEKVVAVAKVCLRDRQARCVIVPHGNGALMLYTLEWAAAIRAPDEDVLALQGEKVAAPERKAARELVKAMVMDASVLENLTDDLDERIEALVASGEKIEPPTATEPGKPAGDVMEQIDATLAEIAAEKVTA